MLQNLFYTIKLYLANHYGHISAVQVQFDPTEYTSPEGETAMIRLELIGESELDIVVRFRTEDVSATGTYITCNRLQVTK